jgi:hypothetical protein
MAVIKNNGQILEIKGRNLERYPKPSDKFDSTLEERERTYELHKPEPRFTEYR